jgi:D-alanyl-D-alanine carboxypeptidase/D-alanyl-D-alanine-endopeptidase (penicillin-binding protein 4)
MPAPPPVGDPSSAARENGVPPAPQRGRASLPPVNAPGSPPAAAAAGSGYGRASVPLNTVRPAPGAPGADSEPGPAIQPGAGATARTSDGARPEAAGRVRRSRTVLISAFSAIVLILVVAVLGLVRPGPVKSWLSADATTAPAKAASAPVPAPTPVLAAAANGGKAPSEAGVKAALDPLIGSKALGTTVHVAVLDVASSRVLYARAADTMTTPASTTKLLTAATVLAARGPAYRLSTRAVAGSGPGEVVLVGGGDPTLSVNGKGLFPGAARLDQLAAQVKKALGGTKPTRVLVDTTLFSGPQTGLGWDPDVISPGGQVARIQPLMTNAGRIKPVHHEFGGDPRYADPAIAAGKAFAKQLGVPSSAVARGAAPKAEPAGASADPAGAGRDLGVVQSPPLVQITDWMLEQSDNTIAEAMGRQVALAAGKPATFDGTTEAIVDKLRELGLPADEADLYDASGLSRHNGVSPTLLTQTLALAASGQQPALTAIFGGLPVAGWSGTLADRFVTPGPNRVGQGVVRAKTGTLSGVNTMAGELMTRDGRLLVFAIMASGSGNAATAKAAVDKVPARLVACGC